MRLHEPWEMAGQGSDAAETAAPAAPQETDGAAPKDSNLEPWERVALNQKKEPWERAGSKQTDKSKAEMDATILSRQTGFGDPIVGAAQLASHIDPIQMLLEGVGLLPKGQIDDIAKQREQALKEKREAAGQGGYDWDRLMGEMSNPVTFVGGGLGKLVSAGRPALASMVTGMGMGGLAGATQPVADTENYAATKAQQTVEGAAVGGAFGAAGGTKAADHALAAVLKAKTGHAHSIISDVVSAIREMVESAKGGGARAKFVRPEIAPAIMNIGTGPANQ